MWKKADKDSKSSKSKIDEIQTITSLTPQIVDTSMKEKSIIGKGVMIKGDIISDEDLLIQGQIDGTVCVRNNQLHIGRHGHLKANIYAKTILIEGHLVGNAYSNEQIIVRKLGHIRGNLIAPRVTIEDGAILKGNIDMDKEAIEKCFPSEKTTSQKQPESLTIADAIHTPIKNHSKQIKNEKIVKVEP